MTHSGESVGAEPFGLEVVPLSALQVVVVDHVCLALIVAQHLASNNMTPYGGTTCVFRD